MIVLGALVSLAVAQNGPSSAAACAAFSRSGLLARATVSGRSLFLELRDTQGKSSHVTTQLARDGDHCGAALSSDSRFLAVEVRNSADEKRPLEIAVWDFQQRRWLSGQPFIPLVPEGFRGSLQGFLPDSAKMVLADSGTYFEDRDRTSLFPLIEEIDPGAGTLVGRNDARAFPGAPLRRWSGVVDGANNRLWFKGNLPGCGFQSANLVGRWERGPTLDSIRLREGGCTFPDLVLPAADSVIIGGKQGSTIAFWKSDLESGNVQRLVLPASPKERVVLGKRAVIAPDGSLMAVSVMRFTERLPSVFDGPEHQIVIVQLKPFRVLGEVKGNRLVPPGALAIGRQGSSAQVLFFSKGEWAEAAFKIAE